MMWVFGFAFWWTFDDTLARTLGNPGLGEMPWWVVMLGAFALHMVCGADIEERIKALQSRSEKKGGC